MLGGWLIFMSEMPFLYYNKSLYENANSLRNSLTKAEACLWKYILRARQLESYQFRRQRPILHYIADFMCKELRLIIEVDGVTHNDENVRKNDKIRQMDLESFGFKVTRFTDEQVLTNIAGVRIEILEIIEKIKVNHPLPISLV
jgi:very-short-patch-repair endonuclease